MQASCPLLHPRTPSFPLTLPSPCCLHCLLSRIRSPTLLTTLRRGAVSLLRTLATSPEQLLGRAPRLALDLLIELLATLSTLSDRRDNHLANDIRSAIAELAVAFDADAPDPHDMQANSYALVELVATNAVDGALSEPKGPKSRSAQVARQPTLLLADLLRAARAHPQLSNDSVLHALDAAVRGRAAALGQRVLAVLPVAEDMFRDVGEVFCSILVAIDWKEVDCQAVVRAVSNGLPHRKVPEADRLFLDVVCTLWRRAIEAGYEKGGELAMVASTLMESEQFVEVIKSSMLSDDIETVERVTKIVCALCIENAEIAEQLCASGVFEYIVESIRAIGQDCGNLSTERKDKLCLAIRSISAIVARKPQSLSQKWCYCLDVIVSVCEHLSEEPHAHMLTEIIGHAFKEAALPVFTDEIIEKFVAFEMMLCTRMCDNATRMDNTKQVECDVNQVPQYKDALNRGIEHLTELFGRYRPSVETMHSVLRICETAAQPKEPLPCLFELMARLVTQFGLICEAFENGQPGNILVVQALGQRLIFIIFDTWACALEETLQDSDRMLLVFDSINAFFSLLDMFSTALCPVFVSSGCCSDDDLKGMRSWCWKYLPPGKVWHICSELDRLALLEPPNTKETEKRLSVQTFLSRISRKEGLVDSENHAAIDTTEDSYLESLASGGYLKSEDSAMMLLETSMELDSVAGLGTPDLLAHALCTRLRNLLSLQKTTPRQILETVRGVSFICCRYGLQLQLFDLPPQTMELALQSEDFSVSESKDLIVFQQLVTRGRTSHADVLAWNSFAEFYQTLDARGLSQESEVWTMLCENTHAVASVVHAILKSKHPPNIVSFLLDMFDARGTHSKLANSFEKARVTDVLCSLLRSLPTHLPTRSTSADVEADEGPATELRRVTCFIEILSHGGFMFRSRPNWKLIRLVCEIFTREVISKEGGPEVFQFLVSLIRCLIATLMKARDGNVISYLHQSGVSVRLAEVLRISFGTSFAQDQVTSVAACLLVLILDSTDSSNVTTPLKLILIDLLKDLNCWERLLCSFPMSSGGDRCCKVTNSCFLLDSLLRLSSLGKENRLAACSRRIILPLTRSASSSDSLLEAAALRVLATMMELSPSQFTGVSAFALLRQLAARNLKKICSAACQSISDVEVRFVRASVLCGHADDILDELEKVLRTWCGVRDHKSTSVQEPGVEEMLSHISALLCTVTDRSRVLGKLNPSGSADDVKDGLRGSSRAPADPVQDGPPQVLSGRYAVALRAQSCSVSIKSIS